MSALEDAVADAVGVAVRSFASVGGGSINRAARAELADGTSVFVKHRPGAPRGTYTVEADGLGWLAETGALSTPRVRGLQDESEPRVLVLDWVERGRPKQGHDEELGQGLAALHAAGADGFGYPIDNLIGSVPQPNARAEDWSAFYGEQRILAMTRTAIDAGRLHTSFGARAERLVTRLPELVGPDEPPARLHGDLWSGNAIVDASGASVLIDPAVYGGHREMDLAMMRLFGGFSERVFAAYEEVAPLAVGASERVRLYQLYPLLVHVVLFGGSYVGSVDRTLAAYA
jgi:fructosamine-3-kinase